MSKINMKLKKHSPALFVYLYIHTQNICKHALKILILTKHCPWQQLASVYSPSCLKKVSLNKLIPFHH
ncbi:ORF1 [Bovine adenovirus 6]|uniref:ORF1 n=1 Tax=Bovine adenovirus 6 TaxID=111167 RepID=K9MNL6_9ADEN|nr:ORF1 [Bovine adenovirus 6]AFV70657.1 ORF1 [Bovine adenovirus 6]